MTTVMLMAAMTPIALGAGPGASARASMAKVIIGGQALSLLLSLLATPVAYSLWDDFGIFWSRITRGQSRSEKTEANSATHANIKIHPAAEA